MKIETDYRSPAQRFANDLASIIVANFSTYGTVTRPSRDIKREGAHVIEVAANGVRFTVEVREGSHR